MFSDIVRKYNVATVKIYGANDEKIKLTVCSSVRSRGIDSPVSTRNAQVNDTKLENNIIRARNAISELAFCNHWDYFMTLTLDPKKFDRSDVPTFQKAFGKFLNNQARKGSKIEYLYVVEPHADGKTYHMHGLVRGIRPEDLIQFKIGHRMGKALADKVRSGEVIYNWLPYAERFGFCDLEPIKSGEAVSNYIRKYINKSLFDNRDLVGRHLYYCSKGLNRAKVHDEGMFLEDNNIPWTYQNDYVRVLWIDNTPENLDFVESLVGHVDYEETRTRALVPKIIRKFRSKILTSVNPDPSQYCSVPDDFDLSGLLESGILYNPSRSRQNQVCR